MHSAQSSLDEKVEAIKELTQSLSTETKADLNLSLSHKVDKVQRKMNKWIDKVEDRIMNLIDQ